MAIKFLNNVAVDTNVLFVDTINDRVGIGTTLPSTKLEVAGVTTISASTTNALYVNNSANSSAAIRSTNTYLSINANNYIILGSTTLNYHGIWALNNKPYRFQETDGTWVDILNLSGTDNVLKFGTITDVSTGGDIAFYTDNSEKMRINSSGNIGIGTTSPGQKLHVAGNIRVGNSTDTIYSNRFTAINNADVELKSNNGYDLLLNSSSGENVGIGASNPLAKLQVNGENAGGGFDALLLINKSTTAGTSTKIKFVNSTDASSTFNTNYINSVRNAGSDNDLIFGTSNADRMTIDSSGNVGIGTNSPSFKLDVSGDGIRNIRSTAGWAGWFQNNASSSGVIITAGVDSGDAPLLIRKQDTTEIFSVRGNGTSYFQNGNVGIGTTSPRTKLDVVNGSSGQSYSNVSGVLIDVNGTSNSYYGLRVGSNTGNNHLCVTNAGRVGIGTTSPSFKLDVDGDVRVSQPSKFTFANGQYLKDDGSAGLDIASISGTGSINFITNSTDKMIITSAGNVGIGTTSPSNKLEVVGSYSSTPLKILRHGDYGNVINLGRNGVSETAHIGYPSDATINFSTAGTERMRINSSGNVGIGTTSPGKTLDVNGDIRLLGTNQFLEGESPTTRLRNMTALPGGYIEPDTFNFRFDESATAYAGESHAIGGTISQTTGTAISDANLKRLFTYTAGYINLNTHKDSNNNVVIELDGISVSNSANNQWKPYVFFHSSAGNVATMTIEVKNGAGNWETVENAIDCVDFYIRDGFYQTSQGVLKGAKFTFTNITGNSYLRMIGVIGKTHASYQWNVLKSGSKMFGDLDFGDTKRATFGNGEDLRILHESNDSYIHHTGAGNLYMKADTGNIEIINYTNDSDIVLSSDDGSGGTTPYLTIDGSTTHAYFSNPGNVGIGTTSPGYKLDVNGDGRINGVTFVASGATRKISTHSNSGQLQLNGGTDASGGAYINVNGSGFSLGRMTLYSPESIYLNSNVGIGTSSPGQKLDVNGNIQLAQYGYIYFGSNSSNQLSLSNSLSGSQITQSGSGNLELQSASNDIHLKAGGLAKAVVRSSGNVGIGTTSPGRQLVVYNSSNAELELYSGATNSGFVYFRDSGDSNIGALQYDHNSNYMAFRVNDSERMRIDSSGKVGIGTTSPQAKLEVGDCESSGNIDDGNIAVKTNSNNTAIVIQESSGAEQWGLGVNSDGDFVLTDSGTERVRIDDNTGNFGIGTTAPAEKLVVSGSDDVSIRIYSTKNGTWTTGQLLGAYEFYGNDASGAGAQIKGKIDCASLNQYGAGFHMRFFTAGGGVGTSAIERMRINSSGAVTIGKTDPSSYNTQGIDLSPSGLASFTRSGNVSLLVNRTGSDGQVVSIRNDNTSVGSISVSGSTTSYNTSSDYRLKENVVDMTGAIERIQQLKPKRFNFISNTEKTVDGFIAHEVQSIIPEAVLGEKDAVDEDGNPEFQGIDQSKIVPLLVGAIKELKAEIENLKSQIN